MIPGAMVAAVQFHGPGEMMGGWGWMMGGAWLLGILFWVALLALIVVAIWKLLSRGGGEGARAGGEERGSGGGGAAEGSALAILERRYAEGEIEREEFLEKRDDLREG